MKALSYLQKNKKVTNYLGFLKTISLNVIRDRWRKNKRHGILINFDENHSAKSDSKDTSETFAERELIQNALMLLKNGP